MVVTLPTTEGTDELKVLTYLAALLAGLAYTVCLLGWLLSGVPTLSPAAIVAAAQAPTAFVAAAWLMGAGRILASGNRAGHGAPSGLWWRLAGLAVAVYAAITAFLPPLVIGAPWFPSAVVLVTGFLMVSGSSPVGRWILHRRDVDELPTARMPTAERQLAVGGALVGACSQAIFWVSLWQSGSAADPTTALWDATQLSLFGSGIAAMIAGVVLRDRILNDARVNPDHVRVLHRVVHRGEQPPGTRNSATRRPATPSPFPTCCSSGCCSSRCSSARRHCRPSRPPAGARSRCSRKSRGLHWQLP